MNTIHTPKVKLKVNSFSNHIPHDQGEWSRADSNRELSAIKN